MSPLDPLQENRFMRTKLIIAIGLSIALATGLAIAKPRNGALGLYLDDGGNVVGPFRVSCDGVFGHSGTRTSHPVTKGPLQCNLPCAAATTTRQTQAHRP